MQAVVFQLTIDQQLAANLPGKPVGREHGRHPAEAEPIRTQKRDLIDYLIWVCLKMLGIFPIIAI